MNDVLRFASVRFIISTAICAASLCCGAIPKGMSQETVRELDTTGERVRILAKALSTARSSDQDGIVRELARIGPAAIPALADSAAASTDRNVRKGAVMALGKLRLSGEQAELAVAALRAAIDDSDGHVQHEAFKSLAELGPSAGEATSKLVGALTAEDSRRSRHAAATLRSILSENSNEAVKSIVDATARPQPHVRKNALWVLAKLQAASTVPRLMKLLDDEDASVRIDAYVAIGEIGPDARQAVPLLMAATKSPHRLVRGVAGQALRKVDPGKAREVLGESYDPVKERLRAVGALMIDRHDWPQLGGSRYRNNTAAGNNIPTDWNPGKFERRTGKWLAEDAKNIKWVSRLGSQSYGNPVVADGKIFVGTNNGAGYLKRYPPQVDLGCLLCFREADGKFLWQHSSEKLASGRVNDWPMQGICSSPTVERDRLWYVTNRGEVRCLDTDGFYDETNDGPFKDEPVKAKQEADVVWVFNMMHELGVFQHNMATCAPTIWGDVLFVCTSNGVDNSHIAIPAPDAPSFIALHKSTGKLLWADNSPGGNILHGQWSCPVVGVFDDVPQVIFPGGDGWLYSFRADRWKDGQGELLWKFDCNPKRSKWILGGRGTRNNIVAYPVIYDDLIYVAVGQDPEHGEGQGRVWCIDPTRRGDVSPELVVDAKRKPVAHRRHQAAREGDIVVANENSAVVWQYDKFDANGDGEFDFEEIMHRSVGSPAIKDDILVIADFSGLVHCLNARTGIPYWTCDLLAACWSTPLIVNDNVYITDEDGDVAILTLSSDPAKSLDADYFPLREMNMHNSVYTVPVVANDVLYIANRTHLVAIEAKSKPPPAPTRTQR